MTKTTKKGVILVGHGSKEPYNKETIEYFASMLRARGEYDFVAAGFMQINTPSIEETMQKALDTGIERLFIVPVFLERGIHLNQDVPAILGLSAGKKSRVINAGGREVQMLYAEPLGKDDRIFEIIRDRIKEVESAAI